MQVHSLGEQWQGHLAARFDSTVPLPGAFCMQSKFVWTRGQNVQEFQSNYINFDNCSSCQQPDFHYFPTPSSSFIPCPFSSLMFFCRRMKLLGAVTKGDRMTSMGQSHRQKMATDSTPPWLRRATPPPLATRPAEVGWQTKPWPTSMWTMRMVNELWCRAPAHPRPFHPLVLWNLMESLWGFNVGTKAEA